MARVLGERPPTLASCPEGPPTCFPRGHDASGNAADDIVPRTPVIAAGPTSSVSFIRADGRHQVAIYAPATDVRTLQAAAEATAPPGPPSESNIDTPTFDRV